MNNYRKIGVVTVTYNSGVVLNDFLESIFSQTHSNFIVYIIDNASNDDTQAIINSNSGGNIKFILNKDNLGVATGNNQGIIMALSDGCEAILLLNNDTVFGNTLFQELDMSLDSLATDMVIPMMLYYEPSDLIWCAGGRFISYHAYGTKHLGDGCRESDWVKMPIKIEYAPTCCMLIKSEVFLQIGLMDDTYFVYSDDVDFCWRAFKAGITLMTLPTSRLWHKVSSLTGGGLSLFGVHYMTRNRVYFLRKHFKGFKLFILLMEYGIYIAYGSISGHFNALEKNTKWKAFKEGLTVPLARP